MFIVRRLSSVGLRTTLQLSQENLRSVKSLATPYLLIDKSVVNTSQNTSKFEAERPKVTDCVLEAEKFQRENFDSLEVDFPCPKCNTINYQVVTKIGYEKGLIMVLCCGCRTNLILADNLGYFNNNGEKRWEECELLKCSLLHQKKLENPKDNKKQAEVVPKDAIQEIIDMYYSKDNMLCNS